MMGEFNPGELMIRLAGGAKTSLGEPAVRSLVNKPQATHEYGSSSALRVEAQTKPQPDAANAPALNNRRNRPDIAQP